MTWRFTAQLATAAIVGAVLFEAGRITAFQDVLHADDALLARMSDTGELPRQGLIDEPDAPAPTHARADGEKSAASKAKKPSAPKSFKRKKYADPPLAEQDKAFVASTEAVVESGDFEMARKLAKSAKKSTRAEVRSAAVRMLAWFGRLGIAELTPYLADADDVVAMEAAAEWKRIFANECNDGERLRVAALALNSLTSAALLEDLGVEDVFNEVDDENAAVAMLVEVVKTGTPAGIKVAKSAYETVTGERWTDEVAARKWMKENAEDSI